MKINYYGTPQFNLDKRFNDKRWVIGKDTRLGRTRKPIKIKAKTIAIVLFFIAIFIFGQMVDRGYFEPKENKVSMVSSVQAKAPELTGEELYKQMIKDKFGPDADNAIKIVGLCENRDWNPEQIGDDYAIKGQHIVSVGLFQIRALKGRPSIEELKNPQTNIDFAYELFKSEGRWGKTSGWYNCAHKLKIY